MKNKIETEAIIGGIAAVIAVIAIIAEAALSGFDKIAIAAGIKDISTTMVAIIVLIVAVSKLKPKKTVETYESVLQEELRIWAEHSKPLVHRAKDYDTGVRYYLITNMDKVFYTGDENLEELSQKGEVNSGTFNGKFVDLPDTGKKEMKFYLNASTFKNRANAKGDSYEDTLEKLSVNISRCITENFNEICSAKPYQDGKTITVTLKKALVTPDDARELVKLIQYVMTLYIIAA